MFNLRGLVSGRALWQLGSETVGRIGGDSLCNCWLVVCDKLEAFCFAFNELMLGGGVGVNVMPEHVYGLPPVKYAPPIKRVDHPDCDFIVPDNREGWVELLWQVLKAFFHTGKPFTYSTQCVRAAGKTIHSFGGTASGSEPLVEGIELIVDILRKRAGEKLRPIDCADIMNIIGTIVVSGNVRRSSEIIIGSPHDLLFLNAKNWNKQTVPNWRSMCNMTVAADSMNELLPEFWEPYNSDGECFGLINLSNCRRLGRLFDGEGYRTDLLVAGCNPCGEANLEDREPCNLAEQFLPRIKDIIQWKQIAVLLYKAAKTIANFQYSDPKTEEVIHRNMRVGLGLSGWMAAPRMRRKDYLNDVYRTLEDADECYSRQLGVNQSAKLTLIKPSGTMSLLPPFVTPGMHAGLSRYLLRRIQFSANDPLVETCRRHGYHVEPRLHLDGSHDPRTMVVEFPMDLGPNAITEDKVNVIDELETQKFLQTHWADQSISCTHYFKQDEVPTIKGWLERNYESSVKTCSFMHSKDHGFKQAPLERQTLEQHVALCEKVTPITKITDNEEIDMHDNLECEGGHCPVR
jgi:ribonucleoside-diphosphate reductase alpha chain/ribonucleoside-triphosphate reductase